MLLIILCVLSTVISICQASTASQCLQNYGHNISHFAVLPGFGWDNLRNVEVSRVVEFNYSDCQLTNDGLYFLPNGVDTIPLKQSRVDVSAEVFNTFTEYVSVTAKSINENPGLSFPESISGSFSDSFLKSKNVQIMEKSAIVRSQMRFVKYKAKLQPDAVVSSAFKVAVLSIARHVLFNRTDMARYESEVLVRDFGTHVITSIDAGASLVREDHLKSDYFNDSIPDNKQNILMGAAQSLSEATGMAIQSNVNQAALSDYRSNLLHSFVQTYGGSMYRSGDVNNPWADNLEDNLVAVDREGIPLYNFVNIQTLPTIPTSILYDVSTHIENAVKSYYTYNTFPGCTDAEDPNFNMQTNVEDGTCQAEQATLVKFGGLFQMCNVVSDDAGDLCSHLTQAHLGTSGFVCPTDFQSRLIYKSHFNKTSSKRVCKKCYGLFNCCDDTPISSSAELKTFWCSATKGSSMYRFSGVYSSVIDNVFTNAKSCPKIAHSRLIGDDITICLTREQSNTSAVDFGGMFSCQAGNPLAKETQDNGNPKGCPKGFSARLAGVINDCAIHYCVPVGSLPTLDTAVRIPPFSPKIKQYPDKDNDAVYDPDQQEWLTELESRELKESEAAVELTTGEAAAIAIFVTIIFLVLLGLIVFFYRRSQRKYSADRRNGTTGGTREDAI